MRSPNADVYREVNKRVDKTESARSVDFSDKYPENKKLLGDPGWNQYERDVEPVVDLSGISGIDIDWSKNKVVKNNYQAAILVSTQLGMVDIDRGEDPKYDPNLVVATTDVLDVCDRVRRLVSWSYGSGDRGEGGFNEFFRYVVPQSLCYRVYETGGGWRVLLIPVVPVVDSLQVNFKQQSELFERVAHYLGCDRRYSRLCYEMKNWRVRLGPKRWRDGESVRVAEFYRQFTADNMIADPDVMKVVRFHDDVACCSWSQCCAAC